MSSPADAPLPQPESASQSDGSWGLTTALADWGLGGLTSNATNAGKNHDSKGTDHKTEQCSPQHPQQEEGANLASDAELASMTEQMDTAVSSAIWSSLRTMQSATGAGNDVDTNETILTEVTEKPEGEGAKPASDAELAAMTEEMQSTAAAAQTAMSSTIWSSLQTVYSATGAENDAVTRETAPAEKAEEQQQQQHTANLASDEELAAMAEKMESTAAAAENAVSSALWSGLQTMSELKADPASLLSLYTSNLKPAGWIKDLEDENAENEPLRDLRKSLDAFVEAHPRGSYEDWVEVVLTQEGWDEGSAVVDNTFYAEESVHRNLWNERNYADGIDVNDESPQRAYVPAAAPSGIVRETDTPTRRLSSAGDDEEIVFDKPKQPAGHMTEDSDKPGGTSDATVVPKTLEQPISEDAGDLDDLLA